jgi:hypothetical protein
MADIAASAGLVAAPLTACSPAGDDRWGAAATTVEAGQEGMDTNIARGPTSGAKNPDESATIASTRTCQNLLSVLPAGSARRIAGGVRVVTRPGSPGVCAVLMLRARPPDAAIAEKARCR